MSEQFEKFDKEESGLYAIYCSLSDSRFSSVFEYPSDVTAVQAFIRFLDKDYPLDDNLSENELKSNKLNRACFNLVRIGKIKRLDITDSKNLVICLGSHAEETLNIALEMFGGDL